MKEKFILHNKVNKAQQKQEKSIDSFSLVFEKIPSQFLKENPIIGLAASRKKKAFMTIIKKYRKPELSGLSNQMDDNEKKVLSEVNDLKEIIYEHYKDKDKEMSNYDRIKNENNKFTKIYNKIRKDKNKFSTGTYLDYKPFLNISNKYISKNMKVPNLSSDHNIFSGNPLILEGSELEEYFMYNLGNKDKAIKFLNKADDILYNKKKGNFIVNTQEMENLENDRNKEKTKGYVPSEIEINKLKKDIRSTKRSFKDLNGFDNFFESLKKRKKIIEKFSLFKNKSSGNLFNNLSNNNIMNSNNNLDNNNNSANNSMNFKNRRKNSRYSQYKNLGLNNSDITASTGINFSRKTSNLETFRELNFHGNANKTLFKQHKSTKTKLSPITPPFLFSSKNIEFHEKFSNNNIPNKKNLNLFLQNSFFLNSPKVKISQIIKKLEISRKNEINKSILNEPNKKENISMLSEGDKNMTHFSEIDDFLQTNKAIGCINVNKLGENHSNLKFKSEIKDYDKNIDLDNDLDEINIKGKEKEPKNHEVKEINEIENLFKIAKRDEINLKDKKKEIENYAILKGKNLKNLLNKKDTYFNIYRLKNKELERNIILEELIFRRGSKIKLPSKNEKLYLAKNKSFLDEIINQEKKIKEIIIENKIQ